MRTRDGDDEVSGRSGDVVMDEPDCQTARLPDWRRCGLTRMQACARGSLSIVSGDVWPVSYRWGVGRVRTLKLLI